ncbi:host cell division inhibitor Icd-like protein [Ewingella americana]|uniref:Host cell division inhibitor Icd-like protein n=1 Tax=Ewingella americana TaxID=41202 RepID=A0A502GTJ8_9GAMM|nr:host cell division inhibitor Icd-like protein [Ewingella americana]TPG64273.1 host cell division inhibitor Icd-like protein [Ewingella americana]
MHQKRLFSGKRLVYSFWAAEKSAVGRRNPSYLLATQHAPGVFFYVVASARLFCAQWFFYRCTHQTMVAQAGQPSGWPVSNKAGIPTPVWATTHKRRNFGGSNNQYLLEAATMATTLAFPHPKFTFLFAAVRRSEPAARICMLRSAADSEHCARRLYSRDYVLCFAGRLPVQEAA